MSRKRNLTVPLLHCVLPALQIPTEIQCNSHHRVETSDKTPQADMSSNSNVMTNALLRNSNSRRGQLLLVGESLIGTACRYH
jgi:hypothetical protein